MSLSLRQQAQLRADAMGEESSDEEAHTAAAAIVNPTFNQTAVNATTESRPSLVSNARSDWHNHGSAKTQALEEKRMPKTDNPTHLVVRIVTGQNRTDIKGANYTTYPIQVANGTQEWKVEHRYSEFEKLNLCCCNHNLKLDANFPSKHWAGRMGNWTPSITWAPAKHDELVAYRSVQLDVWLVHLVEQYNRLALPHALAQVVFEFLTQASGTPCERDNTISQAGWKWNNPMSFTLGSTIRQATQTVKTMCLKGVTEADRSIPLDLLQQARGLAFMTVAKGGLVVSGRIGTGLIIKRVGSGWSCPVAIGTAGVGWGAQVGADVTHYLIVLTTEKAVEDFCSSSSVQLGAELGIAVGPIGRGANSHLRSGDWTLHPAYAYAHSQGLFVGMSLEGSVCRVRHDVNAAFYGRHIQPQELLLQCPGPKAAEPLYLALGDALQQEIRDGAFRFSSFFAPSSCPQPNSSSVQPVVFQPNLMQSTYTVQPSQDNANTERYS